MGAKGNYVYVCFLADPPTTWSTVYSQDDLSCCVPVTDLHVRLLNVDPDPPL